MEKFEFFPIKCRVQRAAEIFKTSTEHQQRKLLNLKVFEKSINVTGIDLQYFYNSSNFMRESSSIHGSTSDNLSK